MERELASKNERIAGGDPLRQTIGVVPSFIEFTAPKCEDGKRKEWAVMSVTHNGVKIHDKVMVTSDNTTWGLGGDVCAPGPILLQDHGHPVQYRNIWLVQQKN